MSDPLILHRKGSIDAEAAVALLLERWPKAETRPMEPHTLPIWFKSWGQHVWCLGLLGDRPADDLYHPIKPTADACMAMLVWRELHECPPGCKMVDCDDCSVEPESAPPTWLRYLDDAVCGRWRLTNSKAVWAWMQTVRPREMVASGGYDGDPTMWAWAGRAILCARERWEANDDRVTRITDRCDEALQRLGQRQPCFLCDGRMVRLGEPCACTLQDSRELDGTTEGLALAYGDTLVKMREERDKLRAELESALETATCCVCADVDEGDRVCLSCVDELAQLDSPTDPP